MHLAYPKCSQDRKHTKAAVTGDAHLADAQCELLHDRRGHARLRCDLSHEVCQELLAALLIHNLEGRRDVLRCKIRYERMTIK